MLSLLHIDNSTLHKEIIKHLSNENKISIHTAKTPSLAYDILDNSSIDLIITGLEFKEESGESFIQNLINKKAPSIPVIVVTSTEDEGLENRLYELGITKFLSKDNFINYMSAFLQDFQIDDAITMQLKSLKIALLDDNEVHMKNIKKVLNNVGVNQVDHYILSSDLLSSDNSYNIYLVDLVLPDIPGEEVIKKIRNLDKYAVIIAVSSQSSHNIISNVLSIGADDFISKPISPNLFLARIKANVRTYSLLNQLKEKNFQLSNLVKVDGLTGLFNHSAIIEFLKIETKRSERNDTPLSLIMFDIDNFKLINDTYGHQIGDEVLVELSEIIKDQSREYDFAGRYGGDEFIVILPETDLTSASKFAERLRKRIEEAQFSKDNLSITISGGLALFTGETHLELIKKADTLLYSAKNIGRNRIESSL